MKQEEKQLLLKDLCARLPYGICIYFEKTFEIFHLSSTKEEHMFPLNDIDVLLNDKFPIQWCKPYLRPMSSMTKEERNEWISLMRKEYREQYPYSAIDTSYYEYFPTIESFDYLNSNHFDYRGLIEKSLALMAPEEMYK